MAQEKYSNPKICQNPLCGKEFTVLLGRWVGKSFERSPNANLRKYCTEACHQEYLANYWKERNAKKNGKLQKSTQYNSLLYKKDKANSV